MKILLITRQFPYPLKDGESIAVQMMSKGLVENGCRVHLFALNSSKHHFQYDDAEISDLDHYTSIKSVDFDNRIKWSQALTNLLTTKSYHVSRYYNTKIEKILVETVKSSNFDIIQFEGLHLLVYLDVIKAHCSSKLFLRAHNVEHKIWERISDNMSRNLKKVYLKIQTRRLKLFETEQSLIVDGVLCVSKLDSLFFLKNGSKNVKIVPIGVENKNFLSTSNKNNNPRIGFIGTLDWIPNRNGLQWYLENVHNEMCHFQKKYELIIAGRNAHLMQAYLSKFEQIVNLGEIDDSSKFWERIDVLIVPLFSGSGTRVKIIEAIARKKLIITTNVGIEGIPAENNVHALIGDNKEYWISALKEIYTDWNSIDTIINSAGDFILDKYDNDKIAKDLVEFYKQLC